MRKSTILIACGFCLLLCPVVAPIAAYMATVSLPREYTSQVTIEVKPNINRPGVFNQGDLVKERLVNASQGSDFVPNQIKMIQSRKILLRVIDELSLVDKWSAGRPVKLTRDEAYAKLLGMLHGIGQMRNTDMLVVPVTSTDPQEAADIANTLAVIYQQKRRKDSDDLINQGLAQLSAEVEKQRKKVDEAKAELEKIRSADNIQDSNPEQDVSPPSTFPSEYEEAKKKYIEAKKLFEEIEQKYETERMQVQITLLPAEIWDRAEPAKYPSGPNVARIVLVAFGLGCLLAIPGGWMLYAGLQLRRQEEALQSEIKDLKSEIPSTHA